MEGGGVEEGGPCAALSRLFFFFLKNSPVELECLLSVDTIRGPQEVKELESLSVNLCDSSSCCCC